MKEKNMKKAGRVTPAKKLRTISVMCLLISCVFGVVFVTSEQVSATYPTLNDLPKFNYDSLNSFQSNVNLDSFKSNYDLKSFQSNINLDSFQSNVNLNSYKINTINWNPPKINTNLNSLPSNINLNSYKINTINWNPPKINTNLNSLPSNINLNSFKSNYDLKSFQSNIDTNYKIPNLHILLREFAISQASTLIFPPLTGMLIGGTFGFALGGPAGAVAGAGIGGTIETAIRGGQNTLSLTEGFAGILSRFRFVEE